MIVFSLAKVPPPRKTQAFSGRRGFLWHISCFQSNTNHFVSISELITIGVGNGETRQAL